MSYVKIKKLYFFFQNVVVFYFFVLFKIFLQKPIKLFFKNFIKNCINFLKEKARSFNNGLHMA